LHAAARIKSIGARDEGREATIVSAPTSAQRDRASLSIDSLG